MTWYRKYRPTTIAGLHLTQVRQLFLQLMQQGRMPQVMLFAGPKGTGKTSTARIIAALLNDPANQALVGHVFFNQKAPAELSFKEPTASDPAVASIFKGNSYVVQELDAASHRGIDDVRAIKEQVAVPPQGGVMSVYILDEVHMLTTEAFNALLKLLEEPPAHAVFILATTEAHKIPATVTSRATVIPFTKATSSEIEAALATVLKAEEIAFEPPALTAIAQRADGSFRDAVKLLETVAEAGSKITSELVNTRLTTSLTEQLQQLVQAVVAKDATQVSFLFRQLRELGVNQDFLLQSLLGFLHHTLLQSLGVEPGQPVVSQAISHFLLQELQTVSKGDASGIPFLSLEVKVLELIFRSQQKGGKSGSAPSDTSGSRRSEVRTQPETEVIVDVRPVRAQSAEHTISVSTLLETPKVVSSDSLQAVSEGDSSKLLEQWDAFIELMHAKNSSVAALLKSAKPLSATSGKAQIAVFYKFHQEQLQQPKFMMMMQECLKPMTGGPVTFEFILQSPVMEQSEAKDMTSLAEELLM